MFKALNDSNKLLVSASSLILLVGLCPLLAFTLLAYLDFPLRPAYQAIPIIQATFLLSVLVVSLFKANFSHKTIIVSAVLGLFFGTAYTVLGFALDHLIYALTLVSTICFGRSFVGKFSFFRTSAFIASLSILSIFHFGHENVILEAYKGENERMNATLLSAVSADNQDWINEKCRHNGIVIDSCQRFPKEFASKAFTEKAMFTANHLVKEYDATQEKQVGFIPLENKSSSFTAISFDGDNWQVAHKDNYYYKNIKDPVYSWIWYWVAVLWIGTFFVANVIYERKNVNNYKRIPAIVILAHVAYLAIVSQSIELIYFLSPDTHVLGVVNQYLSQSAFSFSSVFSTAIANNFIGVLAILLLVAIVHWPKGRESIPFK